MSYLREILNLAINPPVHLRGLGRFGLLVLFSMSLVVTNVAVAQQQESSWTTWRGPNRNGVVDKQKPVTTWSDSENVIWKTKVPGRGHGSPIIADGKIFLPTSDVEAQTQSVLCYDQANGELLWEELVNEGAFNPKIYPKNSHASPSVACDGERVFALFNSHDQNQLTAMSFDGKILWQEFIGPYKTKYPFGSGASPITYKDSVIVPHEANAACALISFDAKTGTEKARIERGSFSSYSTPVIADVAGRLQMLISGGRTVKSYDPDTGNELWSCDASWDVTCGTMVWDGDMVFASGGYPDPQTIAVNAKTGAKLWDKPIKFYEQSMLAHEGRLYGLSDRGVVFCWNAKTGAENFKVRFESPVSASPIVAGGHIYFTSEGGQTLVIKAGTDEYEKVAVNKLGTSAFASFALVNDRLYARVGDDSDGGGLQEWLYCLGKK